MIHGITLSILLTWWGKNYNWNKSKFINNQ